MYIESCIHLEESKRKQLAEMLVTTLGAIREVFIIEISKLCLFICCVP